MLETAVLSTAAWLLLAGASFRFRREAGVSHPRDVRLLRIVAGVILAIVLLRCETSLYGERWVRLLTGMSLGAVAVVLTLSAKPMLAMAPVRGLLRLSRLRPSAPDQRRTATR